MIVGYVDGYLNGSKLSEDQYTASNGTSIVLDEGASLGDIVEVVGVKSVGRPPLATRNTETLTIGSRKCELLQQELSHYQKLVPFQFILLVMPLDG